MKKYLKLLSILFISFASVLAVAHFAFAQAPDLGIDFGRQLGLADADPRIAIANLVRLALTFLGIIAVVIIMYGGFVWMTSNGDAERVSKAKKILTSAIIGLVIILSSFLIVTFVINNISNALSGGCNPACTDPNPKCCSSSNTCVAADQKCCGSNVCDANENCCPGDICTTDNCSNIIPTTESFHVRSTSPANNATNVIRNARIRFVFTRNIDSSYVNMNSFSVETSAGAPIDGNRIVSGNRIEFIPSAACPANPCNAANCFDPNTTIVVTASDDDVTGIMRVGTGDTTLQECSTYPCTISFQVGDLIDCERPTVNINASSQLCLNSDNPLGFNSTDDSGVSLAHFSDSGSNSAFNGSVDFACPGPDCRSWNILPQSSGLVWRPSAPDYNANTSYTIYVHVTDMDSNGATSSRSNIRLKPAHCCNDELDASGDPDLAGGPAETGVDCGGECASCQGAGCGISLSEDCDPANTDNQNCDNTRCASGYCNCGTYINGANPYDSCQEKGYDALVGNDCCVCENRPIIDWITPEGGFCNNNINQPCLSDADCATGCNFTDPNATSGNFITIGGRYFGDATGTVIINGTPAQFASAANPECRDCWSDRQIIAVVPDGFNAGDNVNVYVEQAVTAFRNETPGILRINNISRPGLCGVAPAQGQYETPIIYQGIRLDNTLFYFGDIHHNIPAIGNINLNDTQGNAQVPDIDSGRTTTFASNTQSILSNYLIFQKQEEDPTGPRIISFEPVTGNTGQYVTINGSGFGSRRGNSKVRFGDTEADYTFPAICADSVWSDNQIVVKVPSGLSDAVGYTIYIDLSAQTLDTTALTPDSFLFDANSELSPSICRIRPTLGPVNSPVTLWGEHFGELADNPAIRFQLNHDQTGAAITGWRLGSQGSADEASTTVHLEAVTGPVRIIQGANESNGLNYRVGTCQSNDECGGLTCCPGDTFAAGRCVATANDCYNRVQASAYEWNFNTGLDPNSNNPPCYNGGLPGSCDPSLDQCAVIAPGTVCDYADTCTCIPNPFSCSVYGLDQCGITEYCPNSPGQCSADTNPQDTGVDCANASCNNVGPACTDTTCHYDSTLNLCVSNVETCDAPRMIQDVTEQDYVQAYCAAYTPSGGSAQPRWHIKTRRSCPEGWTNIGNNTCINNTPSINNSVSCNLCTTSGFSCYNQGGPIGLCAVNRSICPPGSSCQGGNCMAAPSCECCCEYGQDARDCCAPLTCEGTCGAGSVNGATFGLCSGCATAGATQADHDAACNCSGHSGKYCDVTADPDNDGTPEGVCRDCTLLNQNQCDEHAGSCCIDNKNSDVCRGGDGSLLNTAAPADAYCPYYDCDETIDICQTADFCDSAYPALNNPYSNTAICERSCRRPTGLGLNCDASASRNCSGTLPNTCQPSICSAPWACMDEAGNTAPADATLGNCGICCCNPSHTNPDDCDALNPAANLECRPNQTPCSGADRGLCCGCTSDADCGIGELGCGYDTCCHQRPIVVETEPADDATNICRNLLISATFDQYMDSRTFSGNVIMLGDYGDESCPAGTEYLAREGYQPVKRNIFTKTYYKILKIIRNTLAPILPSRLARAFTPTGDNNYCAITGTVSSYNNTQGQTVLTFSPSRVLDPQRLYYMIIKGYNPANAQEGVKSDWEIALDQGLNPSTPLDSATFNGITYNNAKIWSFTTVGDQGNSPLCVLHHVDVEPRSYLFKTNRNDTKDDADPQGVTFDKIRDSDKAFVALPKSIDGQTLTPITGVYSWNWVWDAVNPNVAGIVTVTGLEPNRSLVRANTNATDGRTPITATADITVDVYNNNLIDIPGSAMVYVFICDNPWPAENDLGEWAPWVDYLGNCSPGLNNLGCDSANYELYYCRDSGRYGTYDDIPAILNNPIIRGRTDSIFKESYFFREQLPDITGLTLSATPVPAGGAVNLSWNNIVPLPGEEIRYYVIYYGRNSGSYNNYLEVNPATLHTVAEPFVVSNLTNNSTYYFKISVRYASGAETATSTEVVVTPRDTEGPSTPAGFTATAGDRIVVLRWDPVDGADSYLISYGTTAGQYGGSIDAGDYSQVELTGVTNGTTYYFVINSLDDAGNRSATSTPPIAATPLASPSP